MPGAGGALRKTGPPPTFSGPTLSNTKSTRGGPDTTSPTAPVLQPLTPSNHSLRAVWVNGQDGETGILDTQVEWIERNRFDVCDKDETSLQNTIDEIVRQYQTTLYKLRMLK